MAKGDQEDLMSDINKQKGVANAQSSGYMNNLQSRIGGVGTTDPRTGIFTPGYGLRGQQETQLNTVTPQLQNFANTGGIGDDTRLALGRSAGSIADQYRYDIGDSQNKFNTIGAGIVPPDYSAANAGYGDIARTGGIDPTRAQSTFGMLQSGAGPNQDIIKRLMDTNGMYGDVNNTIGQLKNADFSGVNNSIGDLGKIDYSKVNNSISSLNDFAKTGGVTDADKAQINRPLYEEFEKTGGYTPEDIANIKRETNATVGANYNNLSDALNRQKATSGGYGASFGAAQQKLARDSAMASGDQDLSTNIGLADTIRQGRMDAANKISANQLDINRITSPAIVNALSSAGTLGTTMTGQQAANIAKQGELGLGVAQQQGTNLSNAGQLGLSESGQQINALGTAGDLSTRQGQLQLAAAQGDIGAQQAVQQGRLAGLSGLSSNQTNAGQLSLGQAGLLSDNARSVLGAQGNLAGLTSSNVGNLQSMIQQGRQYGTSGLSNLYQSTTNQLSDADRNQLTAMGLSNDQIAKLLEIQQKGAGMAGSNQQMFGNIMSGVGTAAMFL